MDNTTLIVGAGTGLSASLARLLAKEGFKVALAARNTEKRAIAKSYLAVYRQHRSAWTWEMELRPWMEKF
jgi:NAD(P)-dependent dehydrogenase (short-subunit alcohol dehydrogenase family)